MSQRCLDFDPQVVSSMPTQEQTPFIHHASPVRNSSNLSCGNGSAASERPLKNPVVRSRMPSGIGLHLNSLGTFPASSKGSPYGSNLMTASSSKESSKACAGSAGSEFIFSVLENAETDYQEQEAPGSGQSDEGQCVQSLLTFSVEDFPFNIQNKVSQVGRKRLHLDQGATDGENVNEGTISARKRRKSGTPDECCKRCSCKKSKCLKLYCECFASGSYCLESCACRNCSNKPEYEEKVAEIRQQIQSRNPLAFVPRVVPSTVSAYKESHEGVPAMSKHKRGCNCKKSQCLKKYCECYQAQVGCSVSCKCNGCKNTFGMKQGLGSLPDDQSTYGQGAVTAASDDLANVNEDFLFGRPISPGLLNAISAIAPEDPRVNLQARDLESPLQQAASTCSKSSSNFHTFVTPLHGSYGGATNQVSPDLSGSRTSTPKPTCQRQLRPRTMVTRSSANQNGFEGDSMCRQGFMSGKTGSNSLPPGVHSLQSKVLDAGSAAVSQEEDGFPDFLLDPSEVQSPTVTSSPKKKRVTPPQVSVSTQVGSKMNLPPVLKNGRKLTLQALPSLPSVTSIREKSRLKKKIAGFHQLEMCDLTAL